MPDQAEKLRQLVRGAAAADAAPSTTPRMLLVVSAKGGVGTTTVAIQLAAALADLGRGSVLVDADLGKADATSLLGLAPRKGLEALLEGGSSIEQVLVAATERFQILPAAWAASQPCPLTLSAGRRLISELGRLPPDAGWIVVDGGSRRSPLHDHLWHQASRVLMVTTTDDVAVMDSYARIKSLAGTGAAVPVGTLVNRAEQTSLALEVQSRLEQSCRRFLGLTIDAAGHMPAWPALQPAEGHRGGLPSCEPAVTRLFSRLAGRLAEGPKGSLAARSAAA